MTALPPVRPLYLDLAPDPVFAMFHASPDDSPPQTAVLLCPPWGWDEVTSYRSRWAWAAHLAAAGHPTLRFDFPGSGDSGGSPYDSDRLAAWNASVLAATTWLRASTGCSRLAVVGLGLGGLVAALAIDQGAPVDDLVLWASPANGRSFIRGVRAFSRFHDSRYSLTGEPEPMLLPDGWLEASGFVLSAETIQALEPLSLEALSVGGLRRALLLERDGIAVDARVRSHLVEAGVSVAVAPGKGWAAMCLHSDRYDPPLEVFARVNLWLAESPASSAPVTMEAHDERVVSARETVELQIEGARLRERPVILERPFGRLFGLLAEPMDSPIAPACVVFLNPGGIRHTGPSRIWVEASRRWAIRGLPMVRFDLEGLGDSDGDARPYMDVGEYYEPRLVEQVIAFLDALEARGLGPRFVLVGLCAGGYWAFHAAARDPRVTAAVLLNAGALVWDDDLVARRTARMLYRVFPQWRRIVRGEIKASRMREVGRAGAGRAWRAATRLVDRRKRTSPHRSAGQLESLLGKLRDGGTRVVMAFSAEEPVHDELDESGLLARLDSWPNVQLVSLPGRDHTLRMILAQRAVMDLLDREFEFELDQASRAGTSPSNAPAVVP